MTSVILDKMHEGIIYITSTVIGEPFRGYKKTYEEKCKKFFIIFVSSKIFCFDLIGLVFVTYEVFVQKEIQSGSLWKLKRNFEVKEYNLGCRIIVVAI